ncbi:MAG: cytochrome c1 [Rickettsiales bacterium]|nr:cytochrome c1 [Rickettsiales bacterium]
MNIRHTIFKVLILGLCVAFTSPAQAAGDAKHPIDVKWQHDGWFGTFDQASLQRGFQVYRQVCSACHSMDLVAYRNLMDLGYTDQQVRTIASEYTFEAGPNDEGEMFERPGVPADRFKNPYPNKKAAAYANGGALPPDLSLIVKARHYNEDYIYSLLTGYREAPADVTMPSGMYYNDYFPGHKISMAPPLMEGVVMYEDGTEATVEQMAKDVTTFLAWTSDPHKVERNETGIKVLIFLIVFLLIMIGVKRKVWKGVDH